MGRAVADEILGPPAVFHDRHARPLSIVERRVDLGVEARAPALA